MSLYVAGKYEGDLIFHVCGYNNMKKCIYRIVNGTLTLEADKQEDCGVIWNGEPKAISNILTGANAIPIEWNFMQLKDGACIEQDSSIPTFLLFVSRCSIL